MLPNILLLSGSLATSALAYIMLARLKRAQTQEFDKNKIKKSKRLWLFIACLAAWFAASRALALIYGAPQAKRIEVSLLAERTEILGISVSNTTVTMWGIMLIITVAAIVFRLFAVPRFTQKPGRLQNLLELSVEAVESHTKSKVHLSGESLACYMFTVAVLLIGSAAAELVGARPPSADITLTFAIAIISFFMIDYYGIKAKGVAGRIKSFAKPVAVLFPFKIMSYISVPLSLGSRLFGNMLGGMVVMDLLKLALGSYAAGIPAVFGLYFNVFHPLIQAYVFITLTLTFINEAAE